MNSMAGRREPWMGKPETVAGQGFLVADENCKLPW